MDWPLRSVVRWGHVLVGPISWWFSAMYINKTNQLSNRGNYVLVQYVFSFHSDHNITTTIVFNFCRELWFWFWSSSLVGCCLLSSLVMLCFYKKWFLTSIDLLLNCHDFSSVFFEQLGYSKLWSPFLRCYLLKKLLAQQCHRQPHWQAWTSSNRVRDL